ncbi:ribonuclease S-4 [Medicago truncatula]|nr:ribonuclease S-4 [Medicago truncatula]
MSCDFLVLALQWPITYCRPPSNCRTGLPQSLTIRGLWPSTKFPPYPAHCVGKDLSLNMVTSIEDRLHNEWPSLNSGQSDFSFWEMEWNKHGKCSTDVFPDPLTYFSFALTKSRAADIMRVLDLNAIKPSQREIFSAVRIVSAIVNAGFGVPQLECNYLAYPSELREIRLCLHTNGTFMQRCPYNNLKIGCGLTLSWPLQ